MKRFFLPLLLLSILLAACQKKNTTEELGDAFFLNTDIDDLAQAPSGAGPSRRQNLPRLTSGLLANRAFGLQMQSNPIIPSQNDIGNLQDEHSTDAETMAIIKVIRNFFREASSGTNKLSNVDQEHLDIVRAEISSYRSYTNFQLHYIGEIAKTMLVDVQSASARLLINGRSSAMAKRIATIDLVKTDNQWLVIALTLDAVSSEETNLKK